MTSGATVADYNDAPADAQQSEVLKGLTVALSKAEGETCPRCWHYTPDVGKVAAHADICGRCVSNGAGETSGATVADYNDAPADAQQSEVLKGLTVALSKAEGETCPRCWHYTPDVGKVAAHADICGRCVSNGAGDGEKRKCA